MKISKEQIPVIKIAILEKKQNHRCALCRISLKDMSTADICLDHSHETGHIRGVLCRNCNGIEGKVFNLARRAKRDATPIWWLQQLLKYYEDHAEPSGVLHPLHKNKDEKRLLRNKRARLKRAKKK